MSGDEGGALPDRAGSVGEWRQRTRVARGWLAGRFADGRARSVDVDGPPVVLRLSAHNPADATVVRDVFVPSFEVLRRMSNGNLRVQATWGGEVHALPGGWEALAADRTDLAPCYASLEAEKRGFRLVTLLDLPNLFPNAAVGTAVSERLYDRYLRADFERHGVLLARMKATGPTPIFLREPARTIAELRGRPIVTPDGIPARALERVGAAPVVGPGAPLRKLLADGAVDGAVISEAAAEVYGLTRVAPFELLVDLGRTNLPYGLNPSTYARLAPDLRPVLNAWLRAQAQAEAQVFYGAGGAAARERYLAAGGQIVSLEPSAAAIWNDQLSGIEEEAVAGMEREGLPARAFLRDVRELIRAYSARSDNDIMQEAIDRPIDDILV